MDSVDTKHKTVDLRNIQPLEFGRYLEGDAGNHCYFEGSIKNVRIYNKALSKDEIQDLYLNK